VFGQVWQFIKFLKKDTFWNLSYSVVFPMIKRSNMASLCFCVYLTYLFKLEMLLISCSEFCLSSLVSMVCGKSRLW